MPKDLHFLSFDSSVTVLRSNPVVGFAWIELALAFVNKCSRKTRIITIINHLSSPQSLSSRNLTTLSVLLDTPVVNVCVFLEFFFGNANRG